MLSTEDRSYLIYKHRGGENNFKGNCYENYYSVYKIALLLKQFPSNDLTKLSAQLEDSFVDDFYILHKDGTAEFYQIKNVEALTWQSGKSHTIEYDFSRQKELLEEGNEEFSLCLVFSNRECNVYDIPESIKSCTKLDFFPYFPSLNSLLMESSEFKNAISEISANQNNSLDRLSNLSTILLGIWDGIEKKDVPLNEIVDRVKKLESVGHNFIFDEVLQINNLAQTIYDQIPSFNSIGVGSTFYWRYKHSMKGEMQGITYYNFEKAVIRNVPRNFDELELLM